jgi:hypothetical protein
MKTKELKLMQIREFGDVLNASFRFLKNERKQLGKLLLQYFLPFLLIFSALQSFTQVKLMGFLKHIDAANPESALESYKSILTSPTIISNYLFMVLIYTMLLGILYSYIYVYLKKGQGNFTLADVTPLLFGNSIKALGSIIVIYIISGIGLIFCIIPGIYLGISLSITTVALILERKGLGNAMSRSWNLVKTQWWYTLLIIIVGGIIVSVISQIISLPLTLLTVTKTILSAKTGGFPDIPTWYYIAQGVVTLISTTLYFNLVEREERPSIIEKIDQLEKDEE